MPVGLVTFTPVVVASVAGAAVSVLHYGSHAIFDIPEASFRLQSVLENLLSGQNLGEWHSGFRAYSREVLETIPFDRNSDDFVFDSQVLLQIVNSRFKLGDVRVAGKTGNLSGKDPKGRYEWFMGVAPAESP